MKHRSSWKFVSSILISMLLSGCFDGKQDNLDAIVERVIDKGRGVTISVEPGDKK